ncbi:MAG TPA: hypothetical protein VM347_43085 [Nonomuraea sp.]|nr:hypothetical protein [Nonomuraea sp.]
MCVAPPSAGDGSRRAGGAGTSAAPLDARHLVPNSLLIIPAALGVLLPGGLPALGGAALAGAAGLIGAILIASFDDIVDLFARNA